MPKYMILYNSAESAQERMASSTPEEMKAGMEEWMVWKEEAEKSVKFEWGLPLQAMSRITEDGEASESPCIVSGYSTMEGEKDQIMTLLKKHPHLKRDGASIDLLEMLKMPGM